MSECKAQIDPQDFGGVKEKADQAHIRVDKIDTRLESMDQKLDKLKWYIVVALLFSPIANDLVPSGAEVLIAFLGSLGNLVQLTYASL